MFSAQTSPVAGAKLAVGTSVLLTMLLVAATQ